MCNSVILSVVTLIALLFAGTYYYWPSSSPPPIVIDECVESECCQEPWTLEAVRHTTDKTSLYQTLKRNLFGQTIAINMVTYAINGHVNNEEPGRPLVMSFHGTRGIGKSYTSRMIAKHLFRLGTESKYLFHVQCSNTEDMENLRERIEEQLRICERSLFLIDDLEKAASLGRDALNSLYHVLQDNYPASRRAIFIFISNTGQKELEKSLYELKKQGKNRTDVNERLMRETLQKAAYRDESSLKESWLIENRLISYFVPFLPLEREQVELCIREELAKRGLPPSEGDTADILSRMSFAAEWGGLWAEDGCRPVEQLVNAAVIRYSDATMNGGHIQAQGHGQGQGQGHGQGRADL